MRKTVGTLLILLGVLLVLIASVMIGSNLLAQSRAGENAQAALEALEIPSVSEAPAPAQKPHYQLNPEMGMPEKEIDGIAYIGMLELTTLDLRLPVISSTTGSYLQIAPCRFSGSAYLNNLVIGAHNYADHFGRIGDLSYGDLIHLTDMDGNVFSYQVVDIEILQPEQAEALCAGEWPLTLYTCTPGGTTRLTVRCDAVQ